MDDVTVNPPQLWSRAFTWLCVVAFAICGHQSMVLVVIPLYVVHLGGSPLVAGIALFAFSLPSFSSRPVFGHFADSWNLVGVFTIGCLVLGLLSPLYLIPSLAVVFVVNALRGLGWGGAMTGSYTMLAHVSSSARRGEASGYFSGTFSATNIIFPALGLWLVNSVAGGFRLVFLIGSAIALASAAISHIWLRPSVSSGPTPENATRAGRGVVLEREMLLPTALSLTLTLAQPAVIAFLPLYARHQGIQSIAWYFVLSGIASLAVRPVLGKVDDRFGRRYSIVGGFVAQIAGVALILAFGTLPAILAGGVLNAMGNAICNSATVGLAVDMSDPQRRGAAMATFTVSFQLGNGLGSILAGALVSLAGYSSMFIGSLAVLALGLILALKSWGALGIRPPRLLVPALPAG